MTWRSEGDGGEGDSVGPEQDGALSARFREAGDVTLDLLNRDGRVDDCWLELEPAEFALLWRLCDEPRRRLTRHDLRCEVWQRLHQSGANAIAVHVARLRAKLARFGMAGIVVGHPDGRYRLDAPPGPSAFRFGRAEPQALDRRTGLSHLAPGRHKD